MDASFRRSPTSLRFPPRASVLFMLILYRSVTANAAAVSSSPPGVDLLIMSIHGPPTVRTFLKTAIVQGVASVHHCCHDNFLVQSSCLSGPFFLFGSTIHSISAFIPAYPAFPGHLSVNRLTSRASVAPRPGGHLMGGPPLRG
jgi:hypothetical protein